MTDTNRASPSGIARRDFMLAGAGAAALAAGLSATSPALAQADPGPPRHPSRRSRETSWSSGVAACC